MKTPFSRRKWWLLPVILLAVSVIWWLLIDPADGDMQIQKQTLSDSVSVGTLTPKTQVHTPCSPDPPTHGPRTTLPPTCRRWNLPPTAPRTSAWTSAC